MGGFHVTSSVFASCFSGHFSYPTKAVVTEACWQLIGYHGRDETRKLTEERRRLLYRKDITTEEKWNKILICSKHFVGGKPAYVNFRNSPSWLPTLHLGHERSSTCSEAETSKNRYLRLVSRKRSNASVPTLHTASKKRKSISSETSQEEKLCESDFGCSSAFEESLHGDIEDSCSNDQNTQTDFGCSSAFEESLHGDIEDSCSNDQNTQTDLTGLNIDAIMQDSETRLLDSVKNRQHCSIYERQLYVEDEAKVPFYMGLPSLAVMDLIFRTVEPYMSNETQSLSKEQ
ncbi:hypothetical protein C0Q70_17749 [Pomacea canaliculata]|uniref:THAP-type domain-containing protein n=1 Tax=Pomacea canaliculata TaxID=400727 RepID=A0A2T7NLB2_POMCA|nr:hypothetical protein C0Q70_17749 [Pomacea canaliculata]